MGTLSSYTAATSVVDADLLEISQESGGNYTTKKITAANALGSAVGLLSATPGTVTASKAVVVDASKNAGDFAALDCVNLDAGASAVAGTVDVFPTTASCGKLSLTSSNASGNYNTVVTTATSMGQSSTITIPDPGAATADFVLTGGAQTVGGAKTFSSAPIVTVNDATANNIVDVLTIGHTTSGTATTNMGTGISIKTEDASGNNEEIASIDAQLTTATHGATQAADVIVSTMLGGTVAPALTIDASDASVTVGQNATNASGVCKVRVFPVTASKGSLLLTATANTGDTVTSITNAAHGQATALTIPDIGQSTGNIVLLKAAQTTAGELKRADLTEEALAVYGVPLYTLRQADGAAMGVTETAGDHYLRYAANIITLLGEKSNGTVGADVETSVSVFQFVLPPEYVAAGDVKVRVKHHILGAGTTAGSTIDVTCYEQSGNGAIGSDICATGAASTLTASWTTTDFVITAASLVPGDILNIAITTVIDNNNSTDIQAEIDGLAVLCDIKG